MRIIRTKFLRVIGKKYLNLFGVLLTAPKAKVTGGDLNHEKIHTEQMKELLYILFYVWYVIEWLIRLVMLHNAHEAYRNISFEREAYSHEKDQDYLRKRERFAWMKAIR
ncbi:MAG: hypothetical protein VB079_06555 [Petrimonas sp.]|nr:hypothetical protein [Petrimonas sp.]